jgi:hypothetical protein
MAYAAAVIREGMANYLPDPFSEKPVDPGVV